MKQLALKPRVAKFLPALPPKQFRQILSKILSLMENSTPNDSEALHGFPYHRVDTGEYRIVYSFDDETVTILVVGKRNDDEVYKQLKRLEASGYTSTKK